MSQKNIYKVGMRSKAGFIEIFSTSDESKAEKKFRHTLVWYSGPLEVVLLKETWSLICTTPMRVSAHLLSED